MGRSLGMLSIALLLGAGCAEELRCYEGAQEVNGVCECEPGRVFVRDSGACEPRDEVPEAVLDGAVRTDGGAAGPPAEPPPPPPSGACAEGWILCGSQCVDPRTSEEHCGGCNARCGVGTVCEARACREVGCSDGTREAFADLPRFPDVAGCAATWPKSSMRAARELGSCGNGLGGCRVPADACAPGWHLCGAAPTGAVDVTARISQADCASQPGRFALALGDHSCADCGERASGAACCGRGCLLQGGDCLWPDATAWFGALGGSTNLCREIENPLVSATVGVTCCRDR